MKYSDFKKMDFYQAFEDWLYSEISGEFYSSELYSEEGELIHEAQFDEKGCERTVQTTIKAAVQIYDKLDQNPSKLRGKGYEELIQMAGITNDEHIYHIGMYCGMFLCVVADYPNFKRAFKYARWKAFVEIIDSMFDRQNLITWLDFYANFNKYRTIYLLPDKLREDKIMPFWKKLQDKGLVDDEYQIIYKKRIRNYHVAAIANNFRIKTDCTWKILEKHFLSRSKKPFSNLRDEYDKLLRTDKDEFLKTIEECFK